MSAADHKRPWQVLRDDELRSLDLRLLRRLFDEACKKGWGGLKDDHESRRVFFATCHHCATSEGIHSPVAVLKQRMKDCNFRMLRDQSHDWAKTKVEVPVSALHRDGGGIPEVNFKTP